MKILSSPLYAAALLAVSFGAYAQSEIDIGEVTADQGTQVEVPVDLVANNDDLSDFQIDVVFDDSELTLGTNGSAQSCGHVVNGSDLGSDHFVNCSVESANTLRIGVVSNPPTPSAMPEGELLRIIFDIGSGTTPGTYTLQATNASAGDTTGSTVSTVVFGDGAITVSAGPSSVDYTPNPGATIDFGSAEQNGGTSTDTVQICNDGGTGSTLNVTNVSISPSQFTQDGSCDGAALVAGTSDCCTIGMTFAPDGTGTFNGTLNVETDAEGGEGTNGDASFDLTGEGTTGPAPNLSITPTSWTTSTDPGTTTTQTFTVENSGEVSSEADIGTVALATGSEFTITADNCSSTTLNDGNTCTIDVEFGPSTAGTFNDTLNVPATDGINGGDVSVSASLEGTGNGPIFSSNPAPGTVSLGQTPPGGTLDQDVVISNEGNEDLDASCGSLSDPDGVFTLTPDPADFNAANGNAIAPGGSATFNVACTVPDVSTYEATLQCSTNEGAEGQVYDYTFRCVGRPLVIPTMQPWGLVVLTMLMLMVGGLSIRYFRV